MRRVGLARDAGLEARIVAAAAILLVLYAALFAALYGLYRIWVGAWPYLLVAAVALAAASVLHVRSSERLLLSSVDASPKRNGRSRSSIVS